MKTESVFAATNMPEASMISAFLEAHGIQNEIIHDTLPQLAGDIPFSDAMIKIVVRSDVAASARKLIREQTPVNETDDPNDIIPPVTADLHQPPPAPARTFTRFSIFALTVSLLALSFVYVRQNREAKALQREDLYSRTYDQSSGCISGFWPSTNKLAFVTCDKNLNGIDEYYKSFSTQGILVHEMFDADENLIYEKDLEYGKNGKLRNEWYDDDQDGFYDRQIPHEK